MTAPDVLREVAQRLARDIGAVASLVRERGYGTETVRACYEFADMMLAERAR